MPRTGGGGYNLPAGNPVVTNTTIDATAFNNTMTDIGAALAGSIAADGQTAWQGNQNANGNRLTGLANASALSDGTTASDAQTGRLTFLTSVAGTNSITASLPMLASYTTGEVLRFIAANTNTGAATLNVNSLGAVGITKQGSVALIAGDIKAGAVVTVAYDGTQFQLVTAGSGVLTGVQVITGTGTYTPTPGTNSVIVEIVGGGGAGGGAAATAAGQISAGGGGSAGGYARSRLTSGFSGVTVTIGTGGVGVGGGTGGNGGTSSFGALLSGAGGNGSSAGAALAAGSSIIVSGGAGGGNATGGNLVNRLGDSGQAAFYLSTFAFSGAGGNTFFGQAGGSTTNSVGGSASGFGAGGGGAANLASTAARAGGNGGNGVCFVWEYA